MPINSFETRSIIYQALLNMKGFSVYSISQKGDFVIQNLTTGDKVLVEVKAAGTKQTLKPLGNYVTNTKAVEGLKQLFDNKDKYSHKLLLVSGMKAVEDYKGIKIKKSNTLNDKALNMIKASDLSISVSSYIPDFDDIFIQSTHVNKKSYYAVVKELKNEIEKMVLALSPTSSMRLLPVIELILKNDMKNSLVFNEAVLTIMFDDPKYSYRDFCAFSSSNSIPALSQKDFLNTIVLFDEDMANLGDATNEKLSTFEFYKYLKSHTDPQTAAIATYLTRRV